MAPRDHELLEELALGRANLLVEPGQGLGAQGSLGVEDLSELPLGDAAAPERERPVGLADPRCQRGGATRRCVDRGRADRPRRVVRLVAGCRFHCARRIAQLARSGGVVGRGFALRARGLGRRVGVLGARCVRAGGVGILRAGGVGILRAGGVCVGVRVLRARGTRCLLGLGVAPGNVSVTRRVRLGSRRIRRGSRAQHFAGAGGRHRVLEGLDRGQRGLEGLRSEPQALRDVPVRPERVGGLGPLAPQCEVLL